MSTLPLVSWTPYGDVTVLIETEGMTTLLRLPPEVAAEVGAQLLHAAGNAQELKEDPNAAETARQNPSDSVPVNGGDPDREYNPFD